MKTLLYIKDNFNNLLEFQQWAKQSLLNLSPLNTEAAFRFTKTGTENRLWSISGWMPKGTTFTELDNGVKTYYSPELLERLYAKSKEELTLEFRNPIQRRKLAFNAMGLGVFSFERAAMTLHKVKTEGEQGTEKIKTDTKTVFAWFPQKSRLDYAVELFITGVSPANIAQENMLYNGLSAIILAELLIQSGIRVKINLVLVTSKGNDDLTTTGCLIPLKHYEEPLDRNSIALVSSDPRFMRYEAFKGIVCSYDFFNRKVPNAIGYPVKPDQLKTIFEQTGYTQSLQSKTQLYFGGIYSEQEAIASIKRNIQLIQDQLP